MVHAEWRWITDGHLSAERNMEVDAGLLDDCGQGRIPPTVRLYGWSEPAITVGYSQKVEDELDSERCRQLESGKISHRRFRGGFVPKKPLFNRRQDHGAHTGAKE